MGKHGLWEKFDWCGKNVKYFSCRLHHNVRRPRNLRSRRNRQREDGANAKRGGMLAGGEVRANERVSGELVGRGGEGRAVRAKPGGEEGGRSQVNIRKCAELFVTFRSKEHGGLKNCGKM